MSIHRAHPARRRLGDLLAGSGPIDIVEASMLVASEEYDLDVERECSRVHTIAAEAARKAGDFANPFQRFDGIRALLYEQLGFRGNVDQYQDPRNSYLNEVLDRRLGVPLTLSILLIRCAEAAGFVARGVGLPGHFVARLEMGGRQILVDAFHDGEVITADDCRRLVLRTTGRSSLYRPELLAGTDDRGMLARLLMNLKHVYVHAKDYRRALSIVERLLLVRPGDTAELRDRGFIHANLGRPQAAVHDLQRYLAIEPQAPDAKAVRGRVAWLRRQLSQLN